MTPEESWELQCAWRLQVGEVAHQAATLDHQALMLVSTLIGRSIDFTVDLVSDDGVRLLERIAKLGNHVRDEDLGKRVQAWVVESKGFMRERKALVHGIWGRADIDGDEFAVLNIREVVKHVDDPRWRVRRMRVADVEAVAETGQACNQQAHALHLELLHRHPGAARTAEGNQVTYSIPADE